MMCAEKTRTNAAASAPHVHMLVCEATGEDLGFRFGGASSGPVLAVLGDRQYVDPVLQRLSVLPTLPRLRGQLLLLYHEALPAAAPSDIDEVIIDRSLHLPVVDTAAETVARDPVVAGYWTVLQALADMGMISGRGVPRSRIN